MPVRKGLPGLTTCKTACQFYSHLPISSWSHKANLPENSLQRHAILQRFNLNFPPCPTTMKAGTQNDVLDAGLLIQLRPQQANPWSRMAGAPRKFTQTQSKLLASFQTNATKITIHDLQMSYTLPPHLRQRLKRHDESNSEVARSINEITQLVFSPNDLRNVATRLWKDHS